MTTEQITDIPQTATYETPTERNAAIIVACKTRSVRDVANEFGLQENSVYNILARCGVSIRNLRRMRNGKPTKAKTATKPAKAVKSNVETPSVNNVDSYLTLVSDFQNKSIAQLSKRTGVDPMILTMAAGYLRDRGFKVYGD